MAPCVCLVARLKGLVHVAKSWGDVLVGIYDKTCAGEGIGDMHGVGGGLLEGKSFAAMAA